MTDDNTPGRSVHRSTKTLEDAVATFLADFDDRMAAREAAKKGPRPHEAGWHTLDDAAGAVRKLRAAFEAAAGNARPVPRSPYERNVKRISAAQFVELITSQNTGSGTPCTIDCVEGVRMDPVPQSAGTVIKLIAEQFAEELSEAAKALAEQDAILAELLKKPALNKVDREAIRATVNRARRLFDDKAPFLMKIMGEHTEKLMAKGKLEVDAFVQLALQRAGIRAIKDAGGVLMLGSGTSDAPPKKFDDNGGAGY